jgi:LPS export ABC transporter protein LptC
LFQKKIKHPSALLIILIWLFIISCSQDQYQNEDYKEQSMVPDQQIWNATVIFSREDRINSILQAYRLDIFENTGLTIADSAFKLDVFNTRGEHMSVVTADSGLVKGEDSLVAMGNVVVISDSGVKLETEVLSWDRILKKIRSDTSVILTTPTDTLFGDALIADEGLNNWEITHPRGKTTREVIQK